MSLCSLADGKPLPDPRQAGAVLESMDAESRVAWALEQLPGPAVLTSSFGAQSAVMLHLVTRLQPRLPVVLVDTGYLFPETYRFIDQLTERLQLDLRVYRAPLSPAWQEARYGRLWEQGVEGIQRYNEINKVAPLREALAELGARTWFAGLRRQQTDSRRRLPLVDYREGRYKVLPILDWTDRDIYRYLRQHDLPYHPLWEQGYLSIGDVHTTRSLAEAGEHELRFFGLTRECGMHEI